MTNPEAEYAPVATDTVLEINIPRQIVESFTDEALAKLNVEVQSFATRLTLASKAQTANEVVVKDNVDVAASSLRPAQSKDVLKLISDWSKRLAFLFIGFAVLTGNDVFRSLGQGVVPTGESLTIFVVNAVISAVLITASVALDLFSVKKKKSK